MSFADLKKARAVRQAQTPSKAIQTDIAVQSSTDDLSGAGRGDSKPYEAEDGLYSDLRDFLEIRMSSMGRGLYIKDTVQEPIKAGEVRQFQ